MKEESPIQCFLISTCLRTDDPRRENERDLHGHNFNSPISGVHGVNSADHRRTKSLIWHEVRRFGTYTQESRLRASKTLALRPHPGENPGSQQKLHREDACLQSTESWRHCFQGAASTPCTSASMHVRVKMRACVMTIEKNDTKQLHSHHTPPGKQHIRPCRRRHRIVFQEGQQPPTTTNKKKRKKKSDDNTTTKESLKGDDGLSCGFVSIPHLSYARHYLLSTTSVTHHEWRWRRRWRWHVICA